VGTSHPNFELLDATPVAMIVKGVITTLSASDASNSSVLQTIEKFSSANGGSCTTGCVLVFSRPFVPTSSYIIPAFVYEGDFEGGLMRLPGQVTPTQPNSIMATNHFHIYGVDPYVGPFVNFNQTVGFDSLWRYMTGQSAVQAFNRTGVCVGKEILTRILQSVTHGQTEHSVIFVPGTSSGSDHTIYLSVAAMDSSAWDAPYLHWDEFTFEELFDPPQHEKTITLNN